MKQVKTGTVIIFCVHSSESLRGLKSLHSKHKAMLHSHTQLFTLSFSYIDYIHYEATKL